MSAIIRWSLTVGRGPQLVRRTSQCEMWTNFRNNLNNVGECTEAGGEDIPNFSLTFFDIQNKKQTPLERQVMVISLVWTPLDCLIPICRYIQLNDSVRTLSLKIYKTNYSAYFFDNKIF
jgi:hypothetical protein